jgi:hypothetical protein
MGYAGLAMSVAGMAMSAKAAGDQAKASKAQAEYSASVADSNAAISDYQAGIEKQIGAQQEQVSRMNTAQTFSSQRTAMAANGVDIGQSSGTASDILESTRHLGDIDALTIKDNTARKAWALNAQATQLRNDANFQRQSGQAINSNMAIATSLLGNAGALANQWNAYNKANQ